MKVHNLLFVAVLLAGLATAGRAATPETIRIVAFGDSLVAGYQLPAGASFPAQLEASLAADYPGVTVINAGVSGDTTKAGLARLDWTLGDDVDAVILELGANDALRGLPPESTEKALDTILQKLAERDVEVLIAGMRAPPNLGADYATAFDAIFSRLAERHGALLYPFFLDGVAADPALNLPDGMHPTAEGVAVIVDKIRPLVEELIARVRERQSG